MQIHILELVYKVTPMINGNGCIVYFQGGYEHITDSYDNIVSKVIGKTKDKS